MRPASRGYPHPTEYVDDPPTAPVPTRMTAPADDAPPVEARPLTVLDRLGGPWGVVGTAIPQVVFAAAIPFLPLLTTVAISLAVALVLAVVRTARGEPPSMAFGGVLGVAVAGGIALWTGSASDFFLVGIVAALIGLVATAGSLVVSRPLTGLAWNALHGGGHAWRDDRASFRAHVVATSATAAVFAARFVVTQWLYTLDATGGLAIARVAMGTPLTLVAAVVVIWAFRRSTGRLITRRPPERETSGVA